MTLGTTLIYDDLGLPASRAYARYTVMVKELERAGMEMVWLTEHHHNPTRLSPSIPVMMAHLAGQTTMKIGAATVLLSLHDPVRIAEEIGVLENLYPGRFSWGFAKGGGSEVTHSHLAHVSPQNARSVLLENMGAFFNFLDRGDCGGLPLSPVFPQTPDIYMASRDETVIRFAAKHDLGIMAGHKWRLDEIETLIDLYSMHHPHNKPPRLMLSRFFLCAEGRGEAVKTAQSLMQKRKTAMKRLGRAHNSDEGVDMQLLEKESIVGDAAYCKRMIKRFERMGVEHLTLRPVIREPEKIIESIRIVTKD